jgi:Transcriptional antiterminator
MISQKNLNILTYLLDMSSKRQYVSVEELAERFEVSNRTIRYDLEKIDYYLNRKGLAKLERDRKNGIFLDAPPEKIEEVRKGLLTINANTYVLSRDERILYLKMLLFDTEDYLTYDDLSVTLSVSRKTVIEDVHIVKESCEKWDVQVAGTKYGIRLQASEYNLRQMLLGGMLELFTPLELWQILRDIFPNKSIILEKKWRDMAGSDSLAGWEEKLRRSEQEENVSISDAHYYLTVILTVLALRRNQRGYAVEAAVASVQAPPLLKRYFASEPGALPEAEQGYVLAELDRIFCLLVIDKAENMSSAIMENFLLKVSKRLGKKYFSDVELRISLQKHFVSLIENDYVCYDAGGISVKSIIQENPELYRCIHDCLKEIEQLKASPTLDLESALVMLHFLAADERRDAKITTEHSVLIACHNGVGTAKIVSARLEKRFPQLRIIATTAVRNVESHIQEERPDLIISTIPFNYPGIPVIQVNTLMTEDDLERVRICLQGSALQDGGMEQDPYKKVMNAILRSCDIRDEKLLRQEISAFFQRENTTTDLMDLLTEDCITVGLEAADWEAAIRKSARPLVPACVEPRYVDAMVENVKTMGPYIVLTKGMALPHSLSTDGVVRSGISLATLREPVKFGHKYNDPVRLVICIATSNKKEHMREMSKLTELISSKGFVKRICEAADAKTVLQIIHGMNA